jgi:hypothetical protein
MKTISILLVSLLIIGCSVAGLLVASAQQSSPQIGSTLQTTEQQKAAWVARSNPGLHGAAVTCQTDEKHFMHVTKCNFGKHSPEEVINWMIDQNTERDTCGSKGVQWILDKNHKILYGRVTPECPTKKKAKAGAHSEPAGKAASEKPEKK